MVVGDFVDNLAADTGVRGDSDNRDGDERVGVDEGRGRLTR